MTPRIVNPVRRRLATGEPVFAITITVPSAEIAAQAAHLGVDFLWVEMEHSPITLETLRTMVLAAKGAPAAVFARVPVNELWTAKRVLDAGAQGVVFPFTSTPELARQAVDACRYPPLGKRGSGPGLASLTWPDSEGPLSSAGGYHDSADANVFVIAIVEEACALEKIDEIAATPGLDALFIGTSDLSFSLGLRGRQNDPQLSEAIAKISAAAQRNKVPLGRPASTPAQVAEWRKQGFAFFQLTTELGFLRAGARDFLTAVGRAPEASSASQKGTGVLY
jgi:2-keto-3-deoxy-L-rhamnonate aldolase RhmA